MRWQNTRTVIDIGANEGQYATRLRSAGFDGLIVSFGPGSAAFTQLRRNAARDAGWTCHRLALGDRDGSATLNVADDTEGSSLLQVEPREVRNSPGSRFVSSESVPIAKLDSVLPKLALPSAPTYLKLDTQGTELAILRGASRALLGAQFVEAELSLVKLYEGGALFDEVIAFLDERGFGLISLEGIDEEPESGHMLQVDAIFMRRGASS
jgi:FkbM family methyltransferase